MATKIYYRYDRHVNEAKGILLVTALNGNGHAMAIYTAYPRPNGYDLYIKKPLFGHTVEPKAKISFRQLMTAERIERYIRQEKEAEEARKREAEEAEISEHSARMVDAIKKYGMLGVR